MSVCRLPHARAISVVLSFTNGRLPMQCSIRVPADSSIDTIKEAVDALDGSIDLSAARIRLAYVKDSVIEEDGFDASFRLNQYEYSDYTMFVLPPEGCFLGAHGFEEYKRKHTVCKMQVGTQVRVHLRGAAGGVVEGVVKRLLSDFWYEVACSDGQTRCVYPTDLEDGEKYLPTGGDYVYVCLCEWVGGVRRSKESNVGNYGVFRDMSSHSTHHCHVHLYPSDQEMTVSMKHLFWRAMKPRSVYLIQRYLDIVVVSSPLHG